MVIMLTSIVTAFVSVAITLLVVSASNAPESKSEARKKKDSVINLHHVDRATVDQVCKQYPNEEVCVAFREGNAKMSDVLDCFDSPEDYEDYIEYAKKMAENADDLDEFADDFMGRYDWCPKPSFEFMGDVFKEAKLVKMENPKAQVAVDKVAAVTAGISQGIEQILIANASEDMEKGKLKKGREELEDFMMPIRGLPGVDKHPELQSEAAGITVGVFNLAVMAAKNYELNARTKLEKECDAFKEAGQEVLPRRCYYVMAQK